MLGVNGSAIKARRKSDGRIITRDASKFKRLKEPQDEHWRERLLRSSNHKQQKTNIGEEDGMQRRNEEGNDDHREITQTDERQQRGVRKHQPHPPQRRELPKRNRRPPPRLRDFIPSIGRNLNIQFNEFHFDYFYKQNIQFKLFHI